MELWDLYTKDREKLHKTMVRGGDQPEGCYRMVVHICVFSSDGRMLIQQRQPFKSGWSGMWDVSVGGSVVAGESSEQAAARELGEELGLTEDFTHRRASLTINFDNGFDDFYLLNRDVRPEELTLQYSEVRTARWATMEEIFGLIDSGEFIPYHKSFIELLFFMRNHPGTCTRQDTSKPTKQ